MRAPGARLADSQTSAARILVAEDDAVVAMDLRETLLELGHGIMDVVSTGDEALDAALRDPPDLALLDIRMPGRRDGIEVGRALMERKGIPVIYVTAYGDEDTLDRALEISPYGYILKPFDRRDIETAVRIALDRHRLECRLQQSEERFRELAERIEHVFWVSSPEKDRIEYLSPAYEAIWGRSRAEAYRDPESWTDSIHAEDRGRVLEAMGLQKEGEYHIRYRIVRPDGEVRWIADRAFPVLDDEGRPVRLVGVAEDVTHEVALQHRDVQRQKMEAVGQLAGGVAHDFNNLLTVIRSQTDLLLEDVDRSSPQREELEVIRSAAERAANLTSHLLAFSREQILRSRVLDLNEVVRGVGQILGRLIGEDVRIVFDLADSLPAVEIDGGQLEQAILNLAVNARDAMPEGGEITLGTRLETAPPSGGAEGLPHGEWVTLTVSDTGQGIDPDIRSRIFDPFFTTKRPGEGTGLGLAMVYGLVMQSGGMIDVETGSGGGTTFSLRFPARDRPEEPDPARDAPGPATRHAAPVTPGTAARVLVVEDDLDVQDVILRVLRRAGFEAEGVEAAEKAASRLERGPDVHLVITDMGLPGMKGPALIRRVRERLPDLPVIAVSGYPRGAIAEGMDLPEDVELLHKPFGTEVLIRLVRSLLEGTGA